MRDDGWRSFCDGFSPGLSSDTRHPSAVLLICDLAQLACTWLLQPACWVRSPRGGTAPLDPFPKPVDAFLEALPGVILGPLLTLLGCVAQACLEVVVEPLLGVLWQLLSAVLLWAVAVPVCYLVYTPVLLVRSLFGPGAYGGKVADGYRDMTAALPQIITWL